jgi:hypothetical protein
MELGRVGSLRVFGVIGDGGTTGLFHFLSVALISHVDVGFLPLFS